MLLFLRKLGSNRSLHEDDMSVSAQTDGCLTVLLLPSYPRQIFVGNNIDEPLPYSGHLDAGGIAAHLAMLERVSGESID